MTQTVSNRSAWLPWWNVCRRCVGLAARATLLGALFLAPVSAAENEAASPEEPAISPGQEDLLAAMLGKGATLPEECTLIAGEVDHTIVKATYTCPAGEVVFELAHPSTAAATDTQTANFAITLQSGSPPDTLIEALASLIRSQEAAFQWTWLAAEGNDADEDNVED
jgi:hypothetical protein